MRIDLHIGVEHCGAARIQSVLSAARATLAERGVRFAASLGDKNHARLWLAATDPDHVDPLRFYRGFADPAAQEKLRADVRAELLAEVETHRPDVLILSAPQLCWLARRSELEGLRDLLAPISQDIRVIAHVDEQARVLTRLYAAQIFNGRAASLDQEISLAARNDWWATAVKFAPDPDPEKGQFAETQGAAFWLDYQNLVRHWGAVFGAQNVRLIGYDAKTFASPELRQQIAVDFGIDAPLPDAGTSRAHGTPPAPWIARARHMNDLLLTLLARGQYKVPRPLWQSFLEDIAIHGAPIDPGSLHKVSAAFAQANAALLPAHPGLKADTFSLPSPAPDWQEADPGNGFRATQYLLAFKWRLDKAQKTKPATTAPSETPREMTLSDAARAVMPPLAVKNFEKLKRSSFAPHNRIGAVNEEQLAAAYTPAAKSRLRAGRTGNVITGCMKNEAPYILEWIAHHRMIGVDDFLIYTNGCEDGTSEMLDRLQSLGIVQHRLNDDWKGKSPQQHALNCALDEPVIQNADWVIHIDVDEFMNIRCGNGTLSDLFARIPDATNIAMTWRLFGHNGITELSDRFVIEQFDTCAPKFCPKPHTVWGFKTMFKNIGAYEKISCHRPNKLVAGMEERVKWVNGSGKDMTREVVKNGWRNSKKSIGYDLIQLNHYALRSAESFLVKRQRGRALHVDRSIGLNYWIRMDWSDVRDVTIKRNVPRVRAEYERLLADPELRRLHEAGLAWHRAKADALKSVPEFRELFDQALQVKLTQTERVAYALALDMES